MTISIYIHFSHPYLTFLLTLISMHDMCVERELRNYCFLDPYNIQFQHHPEVHTN